MSSTVRKGKIFHIHSDVSFVIIASINHVPACLVLNQSNPRLFENSVILQHRFVQKEEQLTVV
jgi:hypothetical protein